MCWRKSKNIFGISVDVDNTPRNAHQNFHLKFAVDQCFEANTVLPRLSGLVGTAFLQNLNG